MTFPPGPPLVAQGEAEAAQAGRIPAHDRRAQGLCQPAGTRAAHGGDCRRRRRAARRRWWMTPPPSIAARKTTTRSLPASTLSSWRALGRSCRRRADCHCQPRRAGACDAGTAGRAARCDLALPPPVRPPEPTAARRGVAHQQRRPSPCLADEFGNRGWPYTPPPSPCAHTDYRSGTVAMSNDALRQQIRSPRDCTWASLTNSRPRSNATTACSASGWTRTPTSIARALSWRRGDLGVAIVAWNRAIIEQTHDLVCAYKPNIAFYEALGADGMEALRRTLAADSGRRAGHPRRQARRHRQHGAGVRARLL